ncbi:Piso0_002779 [Millerozyma farinosa CBS 7064]|uniref:Piso0_002779 protein n=1 Tax=Pichia sorbitophila (strain ATCC MYA-4447 / BCRC 22081 / CBS 7064 / NBRC 10061 / NRRL Y-12695) TaxID=559304 RepID=G8YFY4_PICSO|nr:Piso0_002779 [Millerozyma farinosa CBS 7064]
MFRREYLIVHGGNASRHMLQIRRLGHGKRIPSDYDATRYRKWIRLDNETEPEHKVSVMSYNMLCQHYMWKQVYGTKRQYYLDWPTYRFPLLNKSIKQLQCDIMCFQEMECALYKNFWSRGFPSDKYTSRYVRKSVPGYWGSLPEDYVDGVGIFVNQDRLEILDERRINFGKYITEHAERFSITPDLRERMVVRNTVALLLKLRDKTTNKTIYVTNTHLYWSPRFNDVKVLQTKLLLDSLRDFMAPEDRKDPCAIVCGDFNCNPNSIVFQLLKTGALRLDACKEFESCSYGPRFNNENISGGLLTSPFQLSWAYEKIKTAPADKFFFTTYTRNFTDILDHIWYTNHTLAVSKLLGSVEHAYYDREDVKGFPNREFPSDHIPLVTELKYK